MKKYLSPVFLLLLFACKTNFESDKRQIIAKDTLRRTVPDRYVRSFDIIGFKEDTLQSWQDSSFKHPIRYTMDFAFNDSTGNQRKKEGIVIFAPTGNTILNVQVADKP